MREQGGGIEKEMERQGKEEGKEMVGWRGPLGPTKFW
jgi:hypothetical protein